MTIPKRTINELRQRLKMEAGIREVYVEGMYDRDLIRWILDKLEFLDVRVYPISTVEVPSILLEQIALTSGERQRVIAVAKEFEEDKDLHSRILFIVDADFDHLLGRAEYRRPLQGTVYSCADLIVWKKEIVAKFLSLSLGRERPMDEVEKLMDRVEDIASNVFLLRAAKEEAGEDWELISLTDTLGRSGDFNLISYCTKVADKNAGRRVLNEKVLPSIDRLKKIVSDRGMNSFQLMNGHDVASVLARLLRNFGFLHKCLLEPEEMARLMMGVIEWNHVADDPNLKILNSTFQRVDTQ